MGQLIINLMVNKSMTSTNCNQYVKLSNLSVHWYIQWSVGKLFDQSFEGGNMAKWLGNQNPEVPGSSPALNTKLEVVSQ